MTDMNRGRFVWHDLMTTDLPKAQEFYTKVFGWGTTVWESGTTPYTMWTAGNTPMGGIMPVQNPAAPPHWLGYISVPDVDAAVKEAQSRGGKVHVPATDIPTVGRFAILGDPQGAAFSVFKGTNPPSADAPPKTGEFSWHELATTDFDAAFRFYEALFGWVKITDHDMGPMGVYRIFGRGSTPLGGMFKQAARHACATELVAVRDGGWRKSRARPRDLEWRTRAERTDGSAGRRLDWSVHGSAGRRSRFTRRRRRRALSDVSRQRG